MYKYGGRSRIFRQGVQAKLSKNSDNIVMFFLVLHLFKIDNWTISGPIVYSNRKIKISRGGGGPNFSRGGPISYFYGDLYQL